MLNTQAASLSFSVSQRVSTAAFAGLLGVFLLYGAAFAQPELLHNAVHDTRHAIVAPCH